MAQSILVTGFKPFYTNTLNPSEILLSTLTENSNISSILLDVSYRDVDHFCQTYPFDNYETILHLGLAQKRKYFSLEQFAYNDIAATIPDNAGEIRNGAIIQNGDSRLETRCCLREIQESLKTLQMPLLISEDPGRYLCNYLYYQTLFRTKMSNRKILFLHLPEFSTAFSFENQTRFVEQLIDLLHKKN